MTIMFILVVFPFTLPAITITPIYDLYYVVSYQKNIIRMLRTSVTM